MHQILKQERDIVISSRPLEATAPAGQKPPIPHDLLAGAPGKQTRNTLASWTKSGSLDASTPEEFAAYEMSMSKPQVIAAIRANTMQPSATSRGLVLITAVIPVSARA